MCLGVVDTQFLRHLPLGGFHTLARVVAPLDDFGRQQLQDVWLVVADSPIELIAALDAELLRNTDGQPDLQLGADRMWTIERGHSTSMRGVFTFFYNVE